MQNSHSTSDFTAPDIIGALVRRNGLSVDSFREISETRVSLFEVTTNTIMDSVKVKFEVHEQNVNNIKRTENENTEKVKLNLTNKAKTEKEIEKNNRRLQTEKTSTFLKAVRRNKWFWVLSTLTVLFMGIWSLVAFLVRSSIIELTDIMGNIIKHFASYSKGIPTFDAIFIIGSGSFWAFAFWAVYVLKYNKSKITNASPKWKLEEACLVMLLILFEILLSLMAIQHASKAMLTNMLLYKSSTADIIIESLPLVFTWLLWHFVIYKIWIDNIRDKVGKISDEIFLIEIKEKLNKAIQQKRKLKILERSLEIEWNEIKKNKAVLHENITVFKTTIYDIRHAAALEKNAVADFGQKWLVYAKDEYVIRGNKNLIHDYETTIKNVVKLVSEQIDQIARKCIEFINKYQQLASLLQITLQAQYVPTNKQNTNSLLPISLILITIFSLSSCAKSTIFNTKTDTEFLNLSIAIDPSDRFLQNEDSIFLPVAHDLSVLETAYHTWEQDVIDSYNLGIDVSLIEGVFSIIPVSMPHESKRDISSLGYRIELSDLPIIKRWEFLPAYKDSVIAHSTLIYNTALKYRPLGADLWAFFRDFHIYIKAPEDSIIWKNKLILLTDGYPYIEGGLKELRKSDGFLRDYLEESDMDMLRKSNKWEEVFEVKNMGFMPTGITYSNLDVLVIGLNEPLNFQGSAAELSIIQRYWSDFFESMGINNYQFIRLNTTGSESIIRKFLKT